MSVSDKIIRAETLAHSAIVPWIVRSVALNRVDQDGVANVAEIYGAPQGVVDTIKAAVVAGTGTPALTGATAAAMAFVQTVAPSSALMTLLADRALHRAPFNTRLIASTGVVANEIAEGAAIPVDQPDFTGQILRPRNVAAIAAATKEIWSNVSAQGQGFVSDLLREAVAAAADGTFFGEIAPAAPTATATAGDQASILTGLRALLNAVHTRPGARLYWALSTDAANELATMDHPRINPLAGSVLGLKSVTTGGLTGAQVALIDGRGLVAEIEDIRFDATDEATLEMADPVTGDSTAPTPATLVSLFQTNSLAARIILRFGVEKVRDNAVATLEIG